MRDLPWTLAARHRAATAAGHETVRSHGMANRERQGETACPVVPKRTMSNNLHISDLYALRNKFARPPGQGASLIERLAVGISGSQTGGQTVLDISMPELVTAGNTFGAWPLNLPPAVSEPFVTLNVPYRFFGVTEQLSFLAQWAGQGFEDLSALNSAWGPAWRHAGETPCYIGESPSPRSISSELWVTPRQPRSQRESP